jgi:type II pantothenate kinase
MILGIDIGSSTTDFVLMENKKLIKSYSSMSDKFDFNKTLEKFPLNEIELIAATGCGSRKLGNKLKGIAVKKVDEIQAIGLGGKFVSKKNRVLVASLGSGTCMVSVDKDIKHIGGTAVGGKTLIGLSKLLLNTDNLNEIQKLAEKGDISKVDLMLNEIYPDGIGLLDTKCSAAHFGHLKDPEKSDLALALFNLVSQSIGATVGFAAKSEGHKDIVFTGKLINLKLIQSIVKMRIDFIGKFNLIIPDNAEIATAIGAVAKINI